jgi:type IV pilus assembly protein PilA
MRNRWKRFDSEDRDAGFTLIELMVVVLIIAILIAIAIPTFLGAREKAQDRAAQSNLRNSLSSVNFYYTDSGSYTGIDFTKMEEIEPSLKWVAGFAPANKEVSVEVSAGAEMVCLSTESDSGNGFAIFDVKSDIGLITAGTYYAKAIPATCTEAGLSGASATQDGF